MAPSVGAEMGRAVGGLELTGSLSPTSGALLSCHLDTDQETSPALTVQPGVLCLLRGETL